MKKRPVPMMYDAAGNLWQTTGYMINGKSTKVRLLRKASKSRV